MLDANSLYMTTGGRQKLRLPRRLGLPAASCIVAARAQVCPRHSDLGPSQVRAVLGCETFADAHSRRVAAWQAMAGAERVWRVLPATEQREDGAEGEGIDGTPRCSLIHVILYFSLIDYWQRKVMTGCNEIGSNLPLRSPSRLWMANNGPVKRRERRGMF